MNEQDDEGVHCTCRKTEVREEAEKRNWEQVVTGKTRERQ